MYDAFGNIAAEYTAAASGVSGTQYVMTDHLGSVRLAMGSTTERHDYLPFGNEQPASGSWRSGVGGYGLGTIRQMYAGDERDNETYLDFLQSRYLSSVQGRFMSVDPGNAGADPRVPQSWNGYAYVGNNPMGYTDPSGLGIFGDVGALFGSFLPGFWPIIGWAIGSIADLANGQSLSPPGFNIGGRDLQQHRGQREQRSVEWRTWTRLFRRATWPHLGWRKRTGWWGLWWGQFGWSDL